MRLRSKVLLAAACLILVAVLFVSLPRYLVVDKPEKSDVMIVLAGGEFPARFERAVALLRSGYAPLILLDAGSDIVVYGHSFKDLADDYVAHLPATIRQQVQVCPVIGDSTTAELPTVRPCLDRVGARSVLIVTSDYHTRRSLDIARRVLPQYRWSAAAAATEVSASPWWRHRWALKYVFLESEKMLWWKLVESHR